MSSSSSEDNIRIISSAFPDLTRDEASNLVVVQGSLLGKQRSARKRRVSHSAEERKCTQDDVSRFCQNFLSLREIFMLF